MGKIFILQQRHNVQASGFLDIAEEGAEAPLERPGRERGRDGNAVRLWVHRGHTGQ